MSLLDYQLQKPRLDERREATIQDAPTLPEPEAIARAIKSLPDLDNENLFRGMPDKTLVEHIGKEICPALSGQKHSSRYYGFVTGGVLPIAEWADNVVTSVDQNVQVHLANQSVSTMVEDLALKMMLKLLQLGDGDTWTGRTFTTGATASNVLGLACGREHVLNRRLNGRESVGELGLLEACMRVGVHEIQVLTSAGHSSLSKAASVVGLGRASVKEMPLSEAEPWRLNIEGLEKQLAVPGIASIIAISAGEVNTGRFATTCLEDMEAIRALADRYGAWIHVDGAFGIFARALGRGKEYDLLRRRVEGLELADSITVDGHKLLNVPYDCGMFFTRSHGLLESVFINPNAAYLKADSGTTIASPLHVGLENSRRFRALPVYAVLLSEGRPGIAKMLGRMVDLSRRVAEFLRNSVYYELLPEEHTSPEETFMIVLFRAIDPVLNDRLVTLINKTRQMYVSETKWKGQKAVRMAVSSWKVDVDRDYAVVSDILGSVAMVGAFDDMEECRP